MDTLPIDIWSDIACPWCYVGKRRLETALEDFEHRDAVRLTWHAFELNPAAPHKPDPSVDYIQRLAGKYGTSAAEARAMIDRMQQTAAAEGLDLRFDRVQPANTFDAHRLVQLGAAHGLQDAVKERLLRAYMTEGGLLTDVRVLTRLASEVGLDADEVRALLASDLYAEHVRQDEAQARALGIHGVPFFVIDRRYGISGAQPAETLLRVLEECWAERAQQPVAADDAVCGPDGCG